MCTCSPERATEPEFTRYDADRLAELLDRLRDAGPDVDCPSALVQRMLSTGCRLYSAQDGSPATTTDPVDPDVVTATNVATTCLGMLKTVNLEVFELTLWGGAMSTKL